MRITLPIDEDIDKLLGEEMLRTGESFDGTINRLLLLGLAESEKSAEVNLKLTPFERT